MRRAVDFLYLKWYNFLGNNSMILIKGEIFMKKTLVSTVTALAIMATQVLPMTAISTPDIITDTAITASAANYAPAKVTGVKASKSYTTVTLSWTKVSKAKGYRVYIYDTATKKYKKITTISKSGTTSYKVTGLTADTAYKFKVRAYRKVSGKTYWGKSSAAVSATTKSYAPVKVTSLTAKATSQTAGTLTWKKIANATGYRVYVYNTATKKYVKVSTITSNKNTYNVTGLKAGTSYKYKVRAYRKVSGKNYWGKSSTAVTLTTNADTSAAALDKAYQALIIGNSTAEQRKLICDDLKAYIKKQRPNLTLNEKGLWAWEDDEGNPVDNSVGASLGLCFNCCLISNEFYSNSYYNPNGYSVFGTSNLSELAQILKSEYYGMLEESEAVAIANGVPFSSFDVEIFESFNSGIVNTCGKDIPCYVGTLLLG